MKLLPISGDKLAIGFSMVCVAHCLAFPLLAVLLPSVTALPMEGETFHLWMVLAVIPTSLYALTLGCKKHGRKDFLLYGALGIVCLVLALLLGEHLLGEAGEKILTVVGAVIVSWAHTRNFTLCQRKTSCPCPEQPAE
ncbi:MerC domain-containing protein [Endozoicomonas sp. G2_1]|uniref:MerC domain-containing protein n=1 Tax=Endozoicomonas sp. G2_1 TaxID=2821091 RepID=UPI001ADC8CFF|nr:MerC domain-containing protein [Endozoicomonas sp. G2_1]MBO9490594.1 MerC domain-containing protein [Endozoicomonas sp. G2_1]